MRGVFVDRRHLTSTSVVKKETDHTVIHPVDQNPLQKRCFPIQGLIQIGFTKSLHDLRSSPIVETGGMFRLKAALVNQALSDRIDVFLYYLTPVGMLVV